MDLFEWSLQVLQADAPMIEVTAGHSAINLPEEQVHPYHFTSAEFERLCIYREAIRNGFYNEGF
jgi:hypothetical protein